MLCIRVACCRLRYSKCLFTYLYVVLSLVILFIHLEDVFYGFFLYADDIIVLSPSVCGLQTML
jgi:hypothetical protein